MPDNTKAAELAEKLTPFNYLLNAFEQASQHAQPATVDYAGKRKALLQHVHELEAKAAKMDALIRASEGRAQDGPDLWWLCEADNIKNGATWTRQPSASDIAWVDDATKKRHVAHRLVLLTASPTPPAAMGAPFKFTHIAYAPLDGTPVLLHMPTTNDGFAVGRWTDGHGGGWTDDEGNFYTHQPVAFMSLKNLSRATVGEVPAADTAALSDALTVDAVAWGSFIRDYDKYNSGDRSMPFSELRQSLSAVIESVSAAPTAAGEVALSSGVEALGAAIERALEEVPVSDVLSVITGTFVSLVTELTRRAGHDATEQIKVDGGNQRDITIHATKVATTQEPSA